jgi:2-polyprenyl-3-methyl-5-hydroxy-6-metoxy-1,4-benzoquinol methylase
MEYSLVKCPCCGSLGQTVKYQERLDIYGNDAEIGICLNCTALVNIFPLLSAIEDDDYIEIQRVSSAHTYQVSEDVLLDAQKKANQLLGVVDFALNYLGDNPRLSFCDFGAGYGYLAAAGALRFQKSYAVEINTNAIKQLLPHYKNNQNINVIESISELDLNSIDLMVLWHTVEHLVDAQDVLKNIYEYIKPGGAIMFQCPMFKSDYVVFSHYFFLNEFSSKILCELVGFESLQCWFAREEEFITCLARKPLGKALNYSITRSSAFLNSPEVISLNRKLEEAEANIKLLLKNNNNIEFEISQMKKTLSWKVTRPLRLIRRFIRQ